MNLVTESKLIGRRSHTHHAFPQTGKFNIERIGHQPTNYHIFATGSLISRHNHGSIYRLSADSDGPCEIEYAMVDSFGQ